MAVDSKDDGDDEHEDDKELAAERKARAARHLAKSQRTVETALDDFIARANEKILDVSGFDAAAREKELQDEIAALKTKLAAAEDAARTQPMKAKAAPVAAPVEPERIVETKMAWGPMLGAFVLGCGLMFGVNMLTKGTDKAPPAETAQPVPVPPAPQPAMAQQPSVEPIAPTPTPAQPTQPAQPTPTEPTQVTQAPTATQAQTPKQPKQPRQPKQPKQPTTTTNTTTTPPAPPAQGSGSGELFNPF